MGRVEGFSRPTLSVGEVSIALRFPLVRIVAECLRLRDDWGYLELQNTILLLGKRLIRLHLAIIRYFKSIIRLLVRHFNHVVVVASTVREHLVLVPLRKHRFLLVWRSEGNCSLLHPS